MAFCSKCGAQLADGAAVCANCGESVGSDSKAEAGSEAAAVSLPFFLGPACYFGGWITGLIILTWLRSAKAGNDARVDFLRFHAAQSITVFGGLTILFLVVASMSIPVLSGAVLAAGFALWLFLMFKASQNQIYKLPTAGDFADSLVKRLG
jgi:uncharacterized membrane protein